MTQEKICYMAGILESASFLIEKSGPMARSKYVPIIKLMINSVALRDDMKYIGWAIEECTVKSWRATLKNKGALLLAKDILPHLIQKKEHAAIFLAFLNFWENQEEGMTFAQKKEYIESLHAQLEGLNDLIKKNHGPHSGKNGKNKKDDSKYKPKESIWDALI
jgi:predicted HTH transcriptional regulator